jgi:hypothetical protein
MSGYDEFRPATTHNPADVRYGREWVVRLPWDKPPASANDRDHWRVKARKVADIRDVACYAVLNATPDNLVVPLFKALVDGIVDAGIVPDDTPEYVLRTMPVILPPDGDPRLELTIREVLAP